MKIEIPDVEGYELAEGEQPRFPKYGDDVVDLQGLDFKWSSHETSPSKFIIIQKKAPVYKTHTCAYGKVVEIKALEDALGIITNLHATDQKLYDTLKELIK